MKRGAPTKKTEAIIDEICKGIAEGKSSRAMCIETGISQQSLWNWLATDNLFFEQYARAKEKCADFYAEEIIEIADDSSKDLIDLDDGGKKIVDHETVNRSRLKIDARKWYASKLAPKKYGDKVLNEHQGGDPDKPINHNIQVSFVAANPQK